MKTREVAIMGMPIKVMVGGPRSGEHIRDVFALLRAVDKRFSTYKASSEISAINRGELAPDDYSVPMKEVFELSEKAKSATAGYFNIRRPDGLIDPSGLVKGWAIEKASQLLDERGIKNYFLDVGGDIMTRGGRSGRPWWIGVRHPLNRDQNVKRLALSGLGIATSGTAERGEHIYDPLTGRAPVGMQSVTVIGPSIMVADVYATTLFAMGVERGLEFIERQAGYEAFIITNDWNGLLTQGFDRYSVDYET
jgi:thiamine biosynthesis lipoprotein